jgi:hypothetical protein
MLEKHHHCVDALLPENMLFFCGIDRLGRLAANVMGLDRRFLHGLCARFLNNSLTSLRQDAERLKRFV